MDCKLCKKSCIFLFLRMRRMSWQYSFYSSPKSKLGRTRRKDDPVLAGSQGYGAGGRVQGCIQRRSSRSTTAKNRSNTKWWSMRRQCCPTGQIEIVIMEEKNNPNSATKSNTHTMIGCGDFLTPFPITIKGWLCPLGPLLLLCKRKKTK